MIADSHLRLFYMFIYRFVFLRIVFTIVFLLGSIKIVRIAKVQYEKRDSQTPNIIFE